MKKWLAALAVVIGFFVTGAVCFLAGMQNGDMSIITIERCIPGLREKRERSQILRFTGYVRGIGQTTLKNKYAGFVSKVRVYSHHQVKKGDVILRYDTDRMRFQLAAAQAAFLPVSFSLKRTGESSMTIVGAM